MSKAEERAKERYWLEPTNIETQKKYAAYIEGYHQAEKDNELSWIDIKVIEKLLGFDNIIESPKEFYQEVLKRFKESKDVKQEI